MDKKKGIYGANGAKPSSKKSGGVNPEQILCVSLDISKYFHLVMLHNGLGEIVAGQVLKVVAGRLQTHQDHLGSHLLDGFIDPLAQLLETGFEDVDLESRPHYLS